MRTTTVRMTERYAHLVPENVRAAVARLDSVSRFSHGRFDEDQSVTLKRAITD